MSRFNAEEDFPLDLFNHQILKTFLIGLNFEESGRLCLVDRMLNLLFRMKFDESENLSLELRSDILDNNFVKIIEGLIYLRWFLICQK